MQLHFLEQVSSEKLKRFDFHLKTSTEYMMVMQQGQADDKWFRGRPDLGRGLKELKFGPEVEDVWLVNTCQYQVIRFRGLKDRG